MKQLRIAVWIMLCAVFVSLLAGCNPFDKQTSTPASADLWVAFPADRAEQIAIGVWLTSDEDLGGYWTPSREDILNVEEKLEDFLRQNSDQFDPEPPVWGQLNNYKRQYAGVVIKDRQVIYGNFFCSDTGIDWKQEWIFVLDGGDCFFQLQFDVESGTFVGLMVNGEA